MNELATVIEILQARGFVFDSFRGECTAWAMGGTSLRRQGDGISIFANAFIIEHAQGQWTVRTDDGRQLASEHVLGGINEVTEFIVSRFGVDQGARVDNGLG